MKPNLSRSLASYKRTPKLGRGDKIGSKKRTSNILGLLSTPGTVKYTKTPIKKTSIKVIKSLKEGKFKPNRRVRIWKVTDTRGLHPPANFQYMNPASYGEGVTEVDTSLYYSSSENWNKKRVKNSKSSNRSSGRGNSAQNEKSDDNFIKGLLHKNEDVENQSSNVAQGEPNLLELWGNKRIEQSLSKFSSHLILPANVEEVPENNNLKNLSVDNIKIK